MIKVESEREKRINLGDGKVAKVWYTENPVTHNLICVKELVNSGVSVNSFERELEIHDAAYVAGVRVPAPYFYVKTKDTGRQYIFMERIEGKSVQQRIDAKEFLSPDEFEIFESSLKEELDRLHEKAHILHRDLHLGNIMILEDLKASIIDFGDSVEDVGQFDSEEEKYRSKMLRNGRFVEVRLPYRDEDIFKKIQKLKG